MPAAEAGAAGRAVVLDTNVALDLLVFDDPGVHALRAALAAGTLRWLVLPQMRAEFARVLDYPRLVAWRRARGCDASAALAAYDAATTVVGPVPAAPCRCRDPDDQPFIDLALAHAALLLSKDRHVLTMRTKLRAHSVEVLQQFITNGHLGMA